MIYLKGKITKDIRIRKAVVKDAAQISSLLGELGYPNTKAFAQEKISKLVKSDNDTVIVADVDGKVIGIAHLHIAELFHEPGKLGRIMAMVVNKNCRQAGIGQRLMNSLETTARNLGCSKMEVTSASHRNDAHKFYLGLGYIENPKRFIKMLDK